MAPVVFLWIGGVPPRFLDANDVRCGGADHGGAARHAVVVNSLVNVV